MQRSLLFGLAFLAACDTDPAGPQDQVQLEWSQADTFHVAAKYRAVNRKSEESSVGLETDSGDTFEESWSDELVWTYQVVDKDVVPDSSDELYEYAVRDDGTVAPIDVIRAYIDPSLNDDEAVLEADPVVYLVFRADRDRLAAVVQFMNDAEGERIEKAWSTKQLGRSYSTLSQSMITAAPTYLAPFSTAYRDEEKTLENGSLLTTELVDDGTVDAFYDDEMGGGLVASRYEVGQPWPTWTVSPNMESRLLAADEVERRRRPFFPDPPENYDYKAGLSRSINLDKALSLDADTLDGGWEDGAPEGFRPWAGSWWKLSEGALIFGYNGRATVSDKVQPSIDQLKRDMDRLSEEIRDKNTSEADKTAKRNEYQQKQEELVNKLVAFYNGMLQELNGGYFKIEDGKLKHTGHGTAGSDAIANIWTETFEYRLDELSPMDKYALAMWDKGMTNPNPWFVPAWEILNHYNPAGGSWWGHCNGWAAAAILTREPTEAVTKSIRGQNVQWTTADIKGLLSESHYSTASSFYGERFNDDEGDDIKDLSPKHFHQIVQFYMRDQKVPLVFDTTADAPVWNYPAWWTDLDIEETTSGGAAGLVNVNTATIAELDAVANVSTAIATEIVRHREAYGPFQSVDALIDVKGIGNATLDKIRSLVTIEVASGERTFEVTAAVTFTTDGVGETHLDDDQDRPEGFTNTYKYTLKTDSKGVVLDGTWDNEREHPDFAWVPYDNPMGASQGGSENPYLVYRDMVTVIGDYRKK